MTKKDHVATDDARAPDGVRDTAREVRRSSGLGGEAGVTRRDFCNFLGVTSGALLVAAAGFAVKSKADSQRKPSSQALKIEGAERMLPGTSLSFSYPAERDAATLVRATNGRYYAFGQKCTHLGCPVAYDRNANRISCPCHLGTYDVRTGSVIFGPPPRALDQIALELRADGEVWATGRRSGGNEHIV